MLTNGASLPAVYQSDAEAPASHPSAVFPRRCLHSGRGQTLAGSTVTRNHEFLTHAPAFCLTRPPRSPIFVIRLIFFALVWLTVNKSQTTFNPMATLSINITWKETFHLKAPFPLTEFKGKDYVCTSCWVIGAQRSTGRAVRNFIKPIFQLKLQI